MQNSKDTLTVRLADGSSLHFEGRAAWALRHLHNAGTAGLTTLQQPAPRWSHYIYLLRKAGLTISTEHEPHGGTYAGHHGRYRLETPVAIVEREVA